MPSAEIKQSRKPFPLKVSRVNISPFRGNTVAVREAVRLYNKGGPSAIGFTKTSSLKSMGLIPRSTGLYVLGDKYVGV
jgi:hypothetical protein